MPSEDSKWRANIHGVKEYEVGRNWKGGGLLWMDLEVDSWFTSTNHKQFFDYYA